MRENNPSPSTDLADQANISSSNDNNHEQRQTRLF